VKRKPLSFLEIRYMATNLLPSILSGSQLQIRIGGLNLAYAQTLTFTHDMTLIPVGGIGSITNHTLEPVRYLARGSLAITQYSDAILTAVKGLNTANPPVPANMINTAPQQSADSSLGGQTKDGFSGNSLLRSTFFNPVMLLLSATVDIDVFERKVPTTGLQAVESGALLYTIEGVRFNSYNLRFSPSSLVTENLGFLGMRVVDRRYTVA
jgi:hypothetical protein